MKMSMAFQKGTDAFWANTLFRFLPDWIKPNHFTLARIILLPFILYFLFNGAYLWALILFAIASLFDTIDGSLARIRGLTSALGAWLDPFADKLLIVFFLFFIFNLYPYQSIIIVIAVIELSAIVISMVTFFILKKPEITKSDLWGKIKMVCQVAGVGLVMVFIIFQLPQALIASGALLGFSIVLSLASVANHLRMVMSPAKPMAKPIPVVEIEKIEE